MKKIVVLMLSLSLAFSGLFFSNISTADAAYVEPSPGGSVSGGYVKSKYYASGGRVNIEYHDYYMSVSAGRTFAKKTEMSFAEGVFWFRTGFIPVISPYAATLGFYRATESSAFASQIRSYTDKNIPVHVTYWNDKNYSTFGRTVTAWDGKAATIKPFKVPAPEYQTIIAKAYK
ncbi:MULTISPECIES: hypothetical protein [unclassified Mesobacillus]|uniref:hypothetical protein n=1 Tax=unclassified Mesobacillus TaxID=2675270 RepID=UPI00203AD62D|nr:MULTISPECIES: hypothetical protein [unclassified Mesobacillus]MCM3126097.1 hypothetical protein [Mesobacillus sp. MER 33]MCM3236076.1 hypothetical protein [Mesobacillus sp. MER 48]